MSESIDIREAFHFLFLQHLFSISDPSLYILKGGVNLRFFFGSPRYSEDMDLDVAGGSVETLRKNGYKILADKSFKRAMQAFGVRDFEVNDPSKAKQTATTQRFRLRLVTEAGMSLPTKVEFSRRSSPTTASDVIKENIVGEIARRYRRLGFPCQHYSGSAAFLQKIRALAGRDTPQCRDVFDLHILRLGGHGSREFACSRIESAVRRKAFETVESLEYDAFVGQVVEFLESDIRKDFDQPGVWDMMRLEILELLRDE